MLLFLDDSAETLVQETKRFLTLQKSSLYVNVNFPPYNSVLVEALVERSRQCEAMLQRSFSTLAERNQSILYQHLAKREKRALFIYHRARMLYLQGLAWKRQPPPETATEAELGFMQGYQQLIRTLLQQWEDVGLGEDISRVPEELYVECRVVREGAGEVQTEWGSIPLVLGSQLYLKWTDVEPLVTAGYLAVLSNKISSTMAGDF